MASPPQAGWLTCILAGLLALATLSASAVEPARPTDVFRGTNIWTVHLRFTPAHWAAMEPKSADNVGGPRRMFGGGFGGAAAVRPMVFLAQSFLQGDLNHDGTLSRAEFTQLGETWFSAWDTNHTGTVNADQLGTGLVSTFGLPDASRPRRGLLGAEGQRNGLAASSGIEFTYVHAELDFAGRVLTNVAVRYKGNGTFMQSRDSLKRSLKVELNKYVKGQKLAGLTKLNLHNNVTDASWMNEVLSHRLFRDAGVPAPRSAYARVFITVPGKFDQQYFGLYSLVEDLDKHFAEERFGTKQGAIFKPVTRELFNYLGDDWAKYNQIYDPKTDLSDQAKRRVFDFAKLVTSAPDADFATRLGDFLDLEEFSRFMAVTVWLSTMDSILGSGQNYYVYLHPATDKFQFLPWDLDHSFGQFALTGTQEQRENVSIHHPWRGENRFLERVFKVEAFKQLYLARLAEFNKTICQPNRFAQQVDELAAAIRPAVKEESDTKLARFDKVVAGEPVERLTLRAGNGRRGNGEPTKPIKPFVKARAQSVQDQLVGNSPGTTIEGFGMGGFANRGGGGMDGTGSATMLQRAFMKAFDANQDGQLTHAKFTQSFAKWFDSWNRDRSGQLTENQLRVGLGEEFTPLRGAQRGGQ